jgi:hypothetical protein
MGLFLIIKNYYLMGMSHVSFLRYKSNLLTILIIRKFILNYGGKRKGFDILRKENTKLLEK